MQKNQLDFHDRLALSVTDACAYLGIRRTKLYALIKAGELPVIRLGAKTLIAMADAKALIERHRVATIAVTKS